MREVEFERQRRRALVMTEWLAGKSASQIAREHALKVSTVSRIISTTPGAREERARRDAHAKQQRAERIAREVTAWSLSHPGDDLAVVASDLDATVTELRALLGPRATLHRHRAGHRRISDQQIIEAIRRHVDSTGDHRGSSYRQAAMPNQWPSLATIVTRFGTWRAALGAAGITTPPRRGRGPALSQDRLHQWIADYFGQASNPSWADLRTWLHTHDGPSISTIRIRGRRVGRHRRSR